MRSRTFFLLMLAIALAIFVAARSYNNEYYFFAIYVVLQYIVLATAWNILGGYTGYVNFGSAAFFALGAYSTVVLTKLTPDAYRSMIDTLWSPLATPLEITVPLFNLLYDVLFPLSLPAMIVVGGIIS